MVKREQVYSPSSASVTSLMLIVSSCDVARTSSIRLSLSAAGTNNQESIINYDTFISICHTLKSGGFSVTFPLFLKVLMHGYWPKDETWKILLPKNYTFNQKKLLTTTKKSISFYDYVHILCCVWRSIPLLQGKKYIFRDGFLSEGKWNMDQSRFKSNITSVNSVQNEHWSIWNIHAWAL